MFRKTLMGFFLMVLLAPLASAQTVDELVSKNIAAKGGLAKVRALQTIKMTGKMTMGPMEAPFTMMSKRPKQTRLEFTVQGMTGVQAYDGQTAWNIMPFAGKKEPEAMSADETKMVDEQADFDGPLVDYKEKGHKLELVGKEQVEGADAYKLKLTLKGGDVRYIYLDAETYLEIKVEAKRMIRGTEIEGETLLGDYKEVDGMMVAHSMEMGAKGSPSEQKQKLTLEKVEFNTAMAESLFRMPASAGADSAKAVAAAAKAAMPDSATAKGAAKSATAKPTKPAAKKADASKTKK